MSVAFRPPEPPRQPEAAGYSLRDTAEELNRKGLTTRAGQPWRFEYVRSALRTVERHPDVSAIG